MTTTQQQQQQPFRPWMPSRNHGVTQNSASKEATANKLYNVWTQRYDPEKKLFEDITLDDIEGEDVMDLFCDYAILLNVHPVFEGWCKPNIGAYEDQPCPKRLSVDYVMKLYTSLFDQLQLKFPDHPLLQGEGGDHDKQQLKWWKNQKTDLRKGLEREGKRAPCC